MKPLRMSLSLTLLVCLVVGAVQPIRGQPANSHAVAKPDTGAISPRVYLPLLVGAGATPTSFELIDQAIAGGRLSAEQGLVYKAFAAFSDGRLPRQYMGAGVGREGDLIMDEVAGQAATLSNWARETLTPFFVPPNDPRSWYYLPRLGAGSSSAAVQATPADWVFKSAAGGKVRVFYYSTNAGDEAKATQIAAQFDATIWSKLTGLMQKMPMPNSDGSTDIYLWNSYIKSNGTVVAFDANTLGITVGSRCDQSAVTIYLPGSLPIGSATSPGLIQYATHEFMHAIQFSYTIQSCPGYRWLKEATATWAEDYVYPQANSEQETASGYLKRTAARLDDKSGLHDYGAYLLFFFLTHEVDPSAAVVRHAWQNAATIGNSYQAMDNAVNQAAGSQWHDSYWPLYLATLWNKAPYDRYYATKDGLTTSVTPAAGGATPITTQGSEHVEPLNVELPTGGAIYFDLTFPDSSVRSLSILNGLGYKLSTGDASSTAYTIDGDETYLTEDLAPTELQGVTVELLLKAHGQAAYAYPSILTNSQATLSEFGYCMDMQGPLDEIVVILSNADFANPNRIMKPAGLPVTVWANNVPCWQVTGTASAIDHDDSGMSYLVEGTVTFGWPSVLPVPQAYQNIANLMFPETGMDLLSAQAHWSVSAGAASDCGYSGSGDYTSSAAANNHLFLAQGLTPGSPTYRGYVGQGDADPGATGGYNVTCPWGSYPETWSDGPPGFLNIPLHDARCGQIQVDASGNMSGSCELPNYEGRYQRYQWNLHGVKK